MTVNGKEVEFKISNLRHAANMQIAIENLSLTEKKIHKMPTKELVPVLKAMISMFREFFITATGEDVLSDCEDVTEASLAYYKFLGDVKGQKTAMLAPYSPDSIE